MRATNPAIRKVLVIDDDPVVGKSFDRVLSPKGYAVISAADGTEALARLASEDYDVVYTDFKMPGMDGLEVAKRIKASRPWLPVVIVTGYGTDANEAEARKLGVADFLRKPLSPEVIEESASSALPVLPALPAPEPAAALAKSAAPRSFVKSAALFVAAPFIGLAFAVALPFVGLGLLAWIAGRALAAHWPRAARFAKNLTLFVSAPFVGLAYALAFPFVGIALLALTGVRAARNRHAA